jgi:hypothetical protein
VESRNPVQGYDGKGQGGPRPAELLSEPRGDGRITIVVETKSGQELRYPYYSSGELATAVRIACCQSLRSPAASVWRNGQCVVRYADGRITGCDGAMWREVDLASGWMVQRERWVQDYIHGRRRSPIAPPPAWYGTVEDDEPWD